MADKYSLMIYSKDNENKDMSKTITDINPEAQPSELKAMAQAFNALTSNVYQSADRVARENVDTAQDKTARNMKVAYVDYSESSSGTAVTIVDGTATIPLTALQNVSDARRLVMNVSNQPALIDDVSRLVLSDLSTTVGTIAVSAINNFLASNNYQFSGTLSSPVAQVITFKLSFSENETYAGWSQLFTITITE